MRYRVGSFEWIHCSWFETDDPDVEEEEFSEPCAGGCGHQVVTGQAYYCCAENSELVHVGCPFPDWG